MDAAGAKKYRYRLREREPWIGIREREREPRILGCWNAIFCYSVSFWPVSNCYDLRRRRQRRLERQVVEQDNRGQSVKTVDWKSAVQYERLVVT